MMALPLPTLSGPMRHDAGRVIVPVVSVIPVVLRVPLAPFTDT